MTYDQLTRGQKDFLDETLIEPMAANLKLNMDARTVMVGKSVKTVNFGVAMAKETVLALHEWMQELDEYSFKALCERLEAK